MPLNTALKVETAVALVLAWFLVFVMPLRWAKALFSTPSLENQTTQARSLGVIGRARAAGVARRVARLSRVMPFSTTCLVKAVAGALLLRRRGMRDVTIRFGVRKAGERLEAHAWLIHDGVILLGGEEAKGFAPLADLSMIRATAPVQASTPVERLHDI